MKSCQRVLLVDAASGYYKTKRYDLGDFFGPVDLGLHLAGKHQSLNFGVGMLAGSIFPGSNRMIFTGYSPCWGGFYISSMGGAGLVFDDLGLNMVSLVGRAPVPSVLLLNRIHGEEIQVAVRPVDAWRVWGSGRGGVYSMMDHVFECYGSEYVNDPRILAVGPAAATTDIGGIVSVPIKKGELSYVDTWAGRGGFGSKMLREHGIAAVIYGGTHVEEDFRDRKVADQWFEDRYQTRMAAKDLEATTKYRFEPKFETGGTFGVNYATLAGQMMSFNYRSIFMEEQDRLDIHQNLVVDHYLKQFNEETIKPKQQKNCGEPCVAVCKKMHGHFKKDYEPYQTMGPNSGVFDQRAAEKLTHHADLLGFDAISAGGVVSWLMENLVDGHLKPEEVGAKDVPIWDLSNFDVVGTSAHNAEIGLDILNAMAEQRGVVDLSEGARKFGRHLARDRGRVALDSFVYTAYARKGWMVPNQYWTPGVLSPMAIMGKYYMYYGKDFVPPRELGRKNAARLQGELILDNLGICRFHRKWAEEMIPEIMESLYGLKDRFLENNRITASRISSRNSSIFWETERCLDYVHTFLKRKQDIEGVDDPVLKEWVGAFEKDKKEAGLAFWYEVHKGSQESLREF